MLCHLATRPMRKTLHRVPLECPLYPIKQLISPVAQMRKLLTRQGHRVQKFGQGRTRNFTFLCLVIKPMTSFWIGETDRPNWMTSRVIKFTVSHSQVVKSLYVLVSLYIEYSDYILHSELGGQVQGQLEQRAHQGKKENPQKMLSTSHSTLYLGEENCSPAPPLQTLPAK